MPYRVGHWKNPGDGSIKFKRLPLSSINCHSKSNVDYKSCSARFEGNGRIRWTYMIAGCKDYVSKASNFSRYAVLVKAPYCHVLPPPVAKGS